MMREKKKSAAHGPNDTTIQHTMRDEKPVESYYIHVGLRSRSQPLAAQELIFLASLAN